MAMTTSTQNSATPDPQPTSTSLPSTTDWKFSTQLVYALHDPRRHERELSNPTYSTITPDTRTAIQNPTQPPPMIPPPPFPIPAVPSSKPEHSFHPSSTSSQQRSIMCKSPFPRRSSCHPFFGKLKWNVNPNLDGWNDRFSHLLFSVTLVASAAGWLTAFIGQIVFEQKFHAQNGVGSAVGVAWFGIFLQLFLIAGVFWTLATDSIAVFRFQISIFTAVALVFAVLGTNEGIYGKQSFQLAVGAGWLILSVVDILWLLYFTSEEDSALYYFFNSMGDGGFSTRRGASSRRSHRTSSVIGMTNANNSPYSGAYTGVKNARSSASVHSGHLGSTNQLNGGMGQNPLSSGLLSPPSNNAGSISNGVGGGVGVGGGATQVGATGSPTQPLINQSAGPPAGVSSPPDYSYKARALYAYNASPDDPNEISFSKGEELEIVDSSGKWWQARKADGSTGIAPSNYLQII